MKEYTVIGAWSDGTPLAFGAVEGRHDVDGDMGYLGFQPWALAVTAQDEQEAMESAVREMEGEA